MPTPEEILKRYWGFDQFRPIQKEIITSVSEQKDTIALLPTGGGKSLCYQLPSLLHNGVTLVITPLIALMQEQVEKLLSLDISAAYISAGMSRADVQRILNNTVEGGYKMLYISPERIQTDLFSEYLPAMNLKLIAIDEAHCISQWGHDFRPDYLKTAELRNIFKKVPVIAVTASATTEVVEDITTQLKIKNAAIFRQSFERHNLNYTIQYSEQKNKDIAELLSQYRGSAIIYCRSRKQTELLSAQLQKSGYSALPYHAGMDNSKRTEHRHQWTNNQVQVMVATTAFGMGIDKADVQSVLHYDVPEHIEAYYQESGRAGRSGAKAYSVVLYNQQDINRLEESTLTQFPPYDFIRKVYQSVAEYLQIPTGAEPYRYYDFDLADFCKKFSLPAPTTARALKLLEQEGLWTLSEAVFKPAMAQILADRQELDNLGRTYPDLNLIITTMLRLYGTLFYHPTAINLKLIAKHLRLKLGIIEKLLVQLDKMEIIQFNQPKDGPQLFFHHYRVASKSLLINTERINALKRAHEIRTKAMVSFITGNYSCRTRTMLEYFGQAYKKNCGHCDVCARNEIATGNTGELSREILELLTTEKTIVEVCNTLSQYYKDDVMNTIRQMIDDGVLRLKANGIIGRA